MKFNKIKLIAVLCLALGVSALGQNNVGTLVTDPVRPFSVSSTHPSAIANEIKGGPFTSSNLAGLSNIPAPRLEIGAIGYATNTGLYYRLTATNPATWSSINGGNITNLNASNIIGTISTSNIPAINFTNISGTLAIASGGTGATNTGGARTNLGLGWPALTNSNLVTHLLGYYNAGPIDTDWHVVSPDWLRFTNWVEMSRLFVGAELRFEEGPSGVAAGITRTNLGLGLLALTNTNNANFRADIGLGTTNNITNRTLVLPQADGLSTSTAYGIQWRNMYPSSNGLIALSGTDDQGETTFRISTGTMSGTTIEVALFNANRITFFEPLVFNNTTNAATTRTNLGLGWAALTNTTTSGFNASLYGSNTNPVLVNTNGEVVSPTNFWQVAPIQTLVQNFTGITVSQTNNVTNARNVYVYSLATNVSGISNTIILPTNTLTFNGDEVTVVHKGTTNTTTVVRQAGATNNLITLNKFDESVKFIRELGQWDFYHNISFVEPIQFSGTNAAANAATTRTNLGLGATDNVTFQNITISDQTLTLSHNVENDVFVKNESGNLEFGNEINGVYFKVEESTLSTRFDVPIYFGNTTNAATTRTNLGLGATDNVTFSNVTASGTLTATSTVTAMTNLVVEGFVNFTTNYTNATPVTPNTPARWLQIRVGTNVFYLPAHQ